MSSSSPILAPLLASLLACTPWDDVVDRGVAHGRRLVLQEKGPDGPVGWWPSLAARPDGTVYLSYCDAGRGDLMLAIRRGGTWSRQTVRAEGNVGKYTSVALAPDGSVAIAYHDQDARTLKLVRRGPKGGWVHEDVAYGEEAGMASELRFDEEGRPHVFFYLKKGALVHAVGPKQPEGPWRREEIAKANGSFTMRLSAVRRPNGWWLGFVNWKFHDTELVFLDLGPHGSHRETVADRHGPGWWNQILVKDDNPLVLYTSNVRPRLMRARRTAGRWRSRTITGDVGNFAARMKKDGTIVVAHESRAFVDGAAGRVYLLVGRPGRWERWLVDDAPWTGSYLALTLDERDRPVVAYHDPRAGSLKVYDMGD